MGYRQYFGKVKKDDVQIIKSLTSQELLDYCKQKGIEIYEDGYISFLDILKELKSVEVFGFGKYYENAEELLKLGIPMFEHKDVQEKFNDYYYPYIVGKEAVACAIEWQRKKILDYFKTLLLSDEEYKKINFYDKRTREERIEEEIRDKVIEWESEWITPYNIDNDEKYGLVNSWLYEYTIFDLVRMYKDTDWENECLIFYGY